MAGSSSPAFPRGHRAVHFFETVAGTALGFLIFDEFPAAPKRRGTAVIAGSGLFTLWRGPAKVKIE